MCLAKTDSETFLHLSKNIYTSMKINYLNNLSSMPNLRKNNFLKKKTLYSFKFFNVRTKKTSIMQGLCIFLYFCKFIALFLPP